MISKHKKTKSRIAGFIEKSGFSVKIWGIFAILAALKLYLVSGQRLSGVGEALYDDRLFVNLADNLLKFKWLGEFDNLTLAKGPFFSMWVTFVNWLHIPLLLSQAILYVVACLVLAVSLRPFFSKIWPLVIVYVAVLFNPVSFTDGPATRAIREGIYLPLTLLIAALFIGLSTRMKKSTKIILIWSIFAGLALSAFWLTREEGVWILPFVVLLLAYSLYAIWKEKIHPLKTKVFLYILPLIMLIFFINLVSAINYSRYGIYNVVEFKTPEFLGAYGALTRVKGSHWQPDVPVSAEKRALIYAVSPAFAELKPYLEGKIGRRWTKTSAKNSGSENSSEITGGWFMWAFRDAVKAAGYYSDGEKAMDYYARLAEEVNATCEKKELECYGVRASMSPPWNKEYLKPLAGAFVQSAIFTAKFEGFNSLPSASVGDDSSLQLFAKITNENISDSSGNPRITALKYIGMIYQYIMPWLLAVSLLLFVYSLIRRKFWLGGFWLIGFFLLSAIAARLFILSMIHITSFPAISVLYVSPVYPLVILFALLNILPFIASEKEV